MALPVRTASVRTTDRDVQTKSSQLRPPNNANQLRKLTSNHSSLPKRAIPPAGEDSSAVEKASSYTANQNSSRIPSPFKQRSIAKSDDVVSDNTNSAQVSTETRSRPRSTVLISLQPHQGVSRTRSTSGVSSISVASDRSSKVTNTNLRKYQLAPRDSDPRKTKLAPRQQSLTNSDLTNCSAAAQSFLVPQQRECLANEFLQLTLVHQDSSQALANYARSIERCLVKGQVELDLMRTDVLGRHQELDAALNLSALNEWFQAHGKEGFCQNVQNLSIILRDLHHLEQRFVGKKGLSGTFESWMKRIVQYTTSKNGGSSDLPTMHIVVEQSMQSELEQFLDQATSTLALLHALPHTSMGSSLHTVVHDHCVLAKSLILECQALLQIRTNVIFTYRKWVEIEVQKALHDHTKDGSRTLSAWED